eukprot:1158786-Pelagomonas_calceolata.AAC.5
MLIMMCSCAAQILYKPSAQSLRADAQDVCSYKCEVCRLAGLSMLDQAQVVPDVDTHASPLIREYTHTHIHIHTFIHTHVRTGSCEPPSSGTPTKSGPDSAAPRPPLPPSLYVPPAPANPRAGQCPSLRMDTWDRCALQWSWAVSRLGVSGKAGQLRARNEWQWWRICCGLTWEGTTCMIPEHD